MRRNPLDQASMRGFGDCGGTPSFGKRTHIRERSRSRYSCPCLGDLLDGLDLSGDGRPGDLFAGQQCPVAGGRGDGLAVPLCLTCRTKVSVSAIAALLVSTLLVFTPTNKKMVLRCDVMLPGEATRGKEKPATPGKRAGSAAGRDALECVLGRRQNSHFARNLL